MNTNYQSGVRIERNIVIFLREHGYSVLRSAGSKGVIDVVAYNTKTVRFIQSKTTKTSSTSYAKDIKSLLDLQIPEYCSKEFWIHVYRKGYKILTTEKDLEYPNGSIIINL